MRPSDLVRAVTLKVIVAFSYNWTKMFIMMSRCVVYKTHDYMSRSHSEVKVKNVQFMTCPGHNLVSYCIFIKLCENVYVVV